ncbi:MAG: hypothetical protein JST00_32145 [Deltaproteobacteria bacterium]|nr:hypothetical protein [Deltaproteobacteria bacterium]
MSDEEITSRRGDALGRRQLGGGRLGTYTALGAACGVVPLPWIPDATLRRVRGALVHDVSSRFGLSLTPDARSVLVEPAGTEGPRGFLSQGVTFAVTKVLGRFGPFALVPPVRSALGTWALGYLLARYLETARTQRSTRIDVEEARRVRRAIDQAMLYALTTEPRPSREESPLSPEDLREPNEQLIDGVLISIASMPGWLVRRLEAAFDEVLASVRA